MCHTRIVTHVERATGKKRREASHREIAYSWSRAGLGDHLRDDLLVLLPRDQDWRIVASHVAYQRREMAWRPALARATAAGVYRYGWAPGKLTLDTLPHLVGFVLRLL